MDHHSSQSFAHSPRSSPSGRSVSTSALKTPISTLSRLIAAREGRNVTGDNFTAFSSQHPARSDGLNELFDFLYTRGFLEGACSDITISAFNKKYNLHRLILDRSPFFSSLFSGPWKDSVCETLDLSLNDPNMTIEAFEIALARLYGHYDSEVEEQHARALLAVASYLDMQDLVEASVDRIIQGLSVVNLSTVFHFAMSSNYGSASSRIINSCKNILYCEGWETGISGWCSIPTTVAAEILSGNPFFVPTEWERCMFVIELINWHIIHNDSSAESSTDATPLANENDAVKTSDSNTDYESAMFGIEPLQNVMETGIHYVHFTFEQIQILDRLRDVNLNRVVSEKTLRDAVWASLSLKQKVLGCFPNEASIGLINKGPLPEDKGGFIIPSTDETTVGVASVSALAKQKSEKSSDHEAGGDGDGVGWTSFAPYRFSLEFKNVSKLREDKRVYSDTIWYAGSYWNIYIQKVRQRKSVLQMGVYLHRAKTSGLTSLSTKDPDNDLSMSMNRMYFSDDNSVNELVQESDVTGGVTTNMSVRSNVVDADIPFGASPRAVQTPTKSVSTSQSIAMPEYLDMRPQILTYFKIFTPSKKGKHAITCFSSSPDYFNFSQSWGWKSTTLCAAVDEQHFSGESSSESDVNLKFMIVLGKV
ncbi:hypothetical protein V1512DRAFT_236628 [Lipomyces arxii]|uniref:uncharacterized protein n=1 Tax=Lipomyces arxii TaxID=56418 RepID=UPI0034CE2707